MSQNKSITAVNKNKLFAGIRPENLKIDFKQGNVFEIREGDVIYQSGDKDDSVYLIIDGEIKVKIPHPVSGSSVVRKIKDEFFGEYEFLENSPRKSSAVANTNSTLYKVNRKDLLTYISKYKKVKPNLTGEHDLQEAEENSHQYADGLNIEMHNIPIAEEKHLLPNDFDALELPNPDEIKDIKDIDDFSWAPDMNQNSGGQEIDSKDFSTAKSDEQQPIDKSKIPEEDSLRLSDDQPLSEDWPFSTDNIKWEETEDEIKSEFTSVSKDDSDSFNINDIKWEDENPETDKLFPGENASTETDISKTGGETGEQHEKINWDSPDVDADKFIYGGKISTNLDDVDIPEKHTGDINQIEEQFDEHEESVNSHEEPPLENNENFDWTGSHDKINWEDLENELNETLAGNSSKTENEIPGAIDNLTPEQEKINEQNFDLNDFDTSREEIPAEMNENQEFPGESITGTEKASPEDTEHGNSNELPELKLTGTEEPQDFSELSKADYFQTKNPEEKNNISDENEETGGSIIQTSAEENYQSYEATSGEEPDMNFQSESINDSLYSDNMQMQEKDKAEIFTGSAFGGEQRDETAETSEEDINKAVLSDLIYLYRSKNMPEVVTTITELIKKYTGVQFCRFYNIDLSNSEIDLLSVEEGKIVHKKYDISNGFAGASALSNKIIQSDNPSNDLRYDSTMDTFGDVEIKDLLCYPVLNNFDEVCALFYLANSASGGFKDNDIKYLSLFAEHALNAIKISNETENNIAVIKPEIQGKISNFVIEDIKAPLLIIKHYADFIKRKETTEEIKLVSGYMINQIDFTLNYSSLVLDFLNNQNNTKPENIKLSEILDEILEMLAEYVESRKVKLFKRYDSDTYLNADKPRLYQAFFQLTKNACGSMPDGGNIYLSASLSHGNIDIGFRDTGKGIPEEKIERSLSGQKNYDEIILELAIAKKIIEDHNGTIELKKNNESGTEFIIRLPNSSIGME